MPNIKRSTVTRYLHTLMYKLLMERSFLEGVFLGRETATLLSTRCAWITNKGLSSSPLPPLASGGRGHSFYRKNYCKTFSLIWLYKILRLMIHNYTLYYSCCTLMIKINTLLLPGLEDKTRHQLTPCSSQPDYRQIFSKIYIFGKQTNYLWKKKAMFHIQANIILSVCLD